MNKKLMFLVMGLIFCGAGRSFAFGPGDIWTDIVANSKNKIITGAELGYAWNLGKENSGPISLKEIYQYRFIVLGAGWTSPFPSNMQGAVIATAGIHLDKLVRQIMPETSDTVKSIMPPYIQPVWERLVFSYAPGYDFDEKDFVHLVAVNFQFGQ